MIITRSTDKPAQHSHDIENIGSSAINDILKVTNDVLTLLPVFLNSFSTWIIWCASIFAVKVFIFL